MQLRDVVYERLRTGIIEGVHDVGTTLREMDIATSLGVSKTPVREAFAKLANDGLVRLVPYRGAMVSDYQPDALQDISGVRQLVEGACAALAARHRSDEELAAMWANLAATEIAAAADDTARVLALFIGLADRQTQRAPAADPEAHGADSRPDGGIGPAAPTDRAGDRRP
jgi:DNA-binding GntR family transcriptional regulator